MMNREYIITRRIAGILLLLSLLLLIGLNYDQH